MIKIINNELFCNLGIPEISVDSYGSKDVSLVFLYQQTSSQRMCRSSCYWRLTGRDGSQLFSLELKGGVVVSAELTLYRPDQVVVRDFSGFPDICDSESTPIFEFEFEDDGSSIGVMGACVDIARDFSVDLHGGRLKIGWSNHGGGRVLAIGSRAFFELTPDGALIAVAFALPDPDFVKSLLLR